jgi:uncharacterized membrane protein
MPASVFKKIKLVLFICLLPIVGWSFWVNAVPITFLSVGGYMALVSLLKTRVKGVIADERQLAASQQAAQVSFQILLPMLLLTSLALLAAGGNQDFYYVKALGIVFLYVTCLGMVVYRLAYWYFDRKTGGGKSDS